MERRLAAILLTDIVGYSRLTGLDEEDTIARQRAHREEVFAPKIAQYGGRIVKTTGDGMLVEFPSVVDAVKCAVEVQTDLVGHEADVPEDRRIQYRIGINLGDIVIDGDDILGDGVNVAARLEALATPGGICVSGSVYDHLAGKLDVVFEDAGEQTVKNVPRPVRVWHWNGGRAARHPNDASKRSLRSDKPSIAVLPFTNMSGDQDQEYFSDGITEDIIAGLSRIGWLIVIARNSSFLFKDKPVDVRQIAGDLGVRYILEGSVRKAGNQIRITAQLIDAQSSSHLWVERYDRNLDEIFAVQDEVVASIVHALGAPDGVLEQSERQRSLETHTKNPTAYDYYLQARNCFDMHGSGNWDKAEELFERAIALDESFAQAYSALAWLHFLRFKILRTSSFERIHHTVRKLALEAIRLDRNDYRAHWVLGFLHTHMGKHSQAIAQFDRALSINPNDANVLVWSAEVLIYWGRPAEALERCERAMRLNPSCPDFYYWLLGFSCFHLGRYEEASDALERMTSPQFARRLLAATYALQGRLEEAKAEAAEYLKSDPDFSIEQWAMTEHYSDPKELQRYVEGLRKAGFPK
jgi:adenylate cyclase